VLDEKADMGIAALAGPLRAEPVNGGPPVPIHKNIGSSGTLSVFGELRVKPLMFFRIACCWLPSLGSLWGSGVMRTTEISRGSPSPRVVGVAAVDRGCGFATLLPRPEGFRNLLLAHAEGLPS